MGISGVEILFEEIVKYPTSGQIVCALVVTVGIIVGIGFCLIFLFNNNIIWRNISLTFIVISLLFYILIIPQEKFMTEGTRYYVTINEETDLKEFYEQYEVIEQKGDIFIVKEKMKNK